VSHGRPRGRGGRPEPELSGQRCWSAIHCQVTHDQAPALFLIMKENQKCPTPKP
jgi:hypothetical protein